MYANESLSGAKFFLKNFKNDGKVSYKYSLKFKK